MSANNHDNHFFQGLFYGLVLGIGLVYFLKTKEGQKIKKELISSGEEIFDEVSNRVIEFLEEKPSTP